jgi:hypothetical protein
MIGAVGQQVVAADGLTIGGWWIDNVIIVP